MPSVADAPLHTSIPSWMLQAIPAIKNLWRNQVAQNLAQHNVELWQKNWGEYPIFKSLKAVYCKEYTAERNEQSALLHRNLGPTDEVVRAVAEDLLFGQENGANDSSGIAYLLALRASPDRSGITADRRLQNACMDVSPLPRQKLMLILACGLT